MTWHLKDRELEEKLIAIDPEFVDKLQTEEGCGKHGFYLDLGGCVYCGDCGVPKIQIYLVREELEEVAEYNPNAWNDSRKVEPPRNVLFRANIHRKGFAGEEWVKHRCILHDGYAWKEVDNFKPWGGIIKLDFDEWIEFRPWED